MLTIPSRCRHLLSLTFQAVIAILLVLIVLPGIIHADELENVLGRLGVDDCVQGQAETTVFFRNDSSFDADLSGATRRGVKLVDIEITNNIRLSDPGRLGRWMAETSRRGGTIDRQVATDEQAMGWGLVVPIAVTMIEQLVRKAGPFVVNARLYGGLYQYNVRVFTIRRGVGAKAIEYIKSMQFSCRH